MAVTLEDFQQWKQDEVTKHLFRVLTDNREYLKELLVTGSIDNPEEVKGRCAAVAQILAVEYEDLMERGV